MNLTLIDKSVAKQIANNFLQVIPGAKDFSYIILDEYIVERPRCFVFFYESSRFVETGRFEDRLVGNAPILVNRETGSAQYLGTALPVESYIAEFEASL